MSSCLTKQYSLDSVFNWYTALFEYETAIYSRLHKIWTVYGWKLKNCWYTAKFRQWINSIPHLPPLSHLYPKFQPDQILLGFELLKLKIRFTLTRFFHLEIELEQIDFEFQQLKSQQNLIGLKFWVEMGERREMRDRVDSLSEFRCISAILQLPAVYSSDFM